MLAKFLTTLITTALCQSGTWAQVDVEQDRSLEKGIVSRARIRQDQKTDELERLLNPIFAEQMTKLRVPGAVITVVEGGRTIFAKGYGLADLERKTPVIPDKTIFRIGSITKVFTAVAVMQLADQGKIKLNDDVNKYLNDVKVPSTFPRPITFHDLLTHTSGLDDINPGRRTSDESKLVPLNEFLKTRIVRQFPPGEIISYSTYSSALAGLAVEQITGTPFRQYVVQNIFGPLRMDRSSFSSVPKELQTDLAGGYEYINEKHYKLPFQWFHTFPASDVNSTATDMARFMVAILQDGVIDGKRILSGSVARRMQKTQFRNHARIPGWAYGFYEGEQNNLRYIEHGGSMDDGYSALLTLIPEKNFGIFVACNTESCAAAMAGKVKAAILDQFFPAKAEQLAIPSGNPSASLSKFAGKYRGILYCHSCAPNSGAYVPEAVEVRVTDDGSLSLFGTRARQVEPLLFVAADGKDAGKLLLGFKENSKGEIAYMFFNNPYNVFERVSP
jgi:CubicO group peptidase (beta-lactamase class C family)